MSFARRPAPPQPITIQRGLPGRTLSVSHKRRFHQKALGSVSLLQILSVTDSSMRPQLKAKFSSQKLG